MTVGIPSERVRRLEVVVREETPILPKIAFVLISLASLGGAIFTGTDLGMRGPALILRWLTLWSIALSGGFLVWRGWYTKSTESDADPERVRAYNRDAGLRARQVARLIALVVVFGAAGPWVAGYLDGRPLLRYLLFLGSCLLALLLLLDVGTTVLARMAAGVAFLLLAGWAYADAGVGVAGLLRMVHFSAFSLWVGGALWNIAVAMPTGRIHASIDAVLAQAHQLDRFRLVVRFVLPSIILTGIAMASAYRGRPLGWWERFPGALIPAKVAIILALVTVFILCPLFRQCSPVKGVCDVRDLDDASGKGISPHDPPLVTVDNRHVPCAMGLIRADETMRSLPSGAKLEIKSKDVYAPMEVKLWAERSGYPLLLQERRGVWLARYHRFVLRRP